SARGAWPQRLRGPAAWWRRGRRRWVRWVRSCGVPQESKAVKVELGAGQEQERDLPLALDRRKAEGLFAPIRLGTKFDDAALAAARALAVKQQVDRVGGQGAAAAQAHAAAAVFAEIHAAECERDVVADAQHLRAGAGEAVAVDGVALPGGQRVEGAGMGRELEAVD